MIVASGAAAATRTAAPPPTSHLSRKEWRAVSEPSARPAEEPERGKLGQSEERTIYEQGSEPPDVDFCSVTINCDAYAGDLLQQRLHVASRQREELEQMEVELRAQIFARSELMEMQKSFDAQLQENANASAKLKEQIMEGEKCLHELEKKFEEKERELCTIKIDNEAAWAKEDLLREQNKELAVFRRQRDTFEVERAQNFKKIHELKEHVREKEGQVFELEEQHRVAQETIHYKDEQLREAQAWVARVQEMDALQSTTNHSLQAELRERTEQFNQFWLGCQRQFQVMERHYMQVIQQLQLQVLEAREQRGVHLDNSQMAHANSTDSSTPVENNGSHLDVSKGGMPNGGLEISSNGNHENKPSFVSASNALTVTDHAAAVPVVPSSILGMSAVLPPGQVTMHPLVMNQQGAVHSMQPSNVHQLHLDHFQLWQNKQAVSENSQIRNHTQYQHSEDPQGLLRSDGHYDYRLSADRVVCADYGKPHVSPAEKSGLVVTTSGNETQVRESSDKMYMTVASKEPQQNILEGHLQYHSEEKQEVQVDDKTGTRDRLQEKSEMKEHSIKDTNLLYSAALNFKGNSREASESDSISLSSPEGSVSSRQISSSVKPVKISGPMLLDERSLLACIVRAIPAGSSSRIRISATLPNRLGKMLAPLHWHDYKQQYGKLDDFLSRHPELFVIEGDYIHLREGAQAIISATTAIAKVAAAAAVVSAPNSSLLPSVAVTPVAQANRVKKVSTAAPLHPADACNQPSQLLEKQSQHSHGSFNDIQGLSNVKLLSKQKVIQQANGFSSEVRSNHSSIFKTVGNGANLEREGLEPSQNKGSSSGRNETHSGGRQRGRAIGSILPSRK